MKQNTPNTRLKNFFEQAYCKKLANEEVLEHKNRLAKFFSLFIEIDQQNRRNSYEPKNIRAPPKFLFVFGLIFR